MTRGRGWWRRGIAITIALVGLAGRVAAQDLMARAFDLERRGSYEEAARVYRSILTTRAGDLGALLGLERSLTPINRLSAMLPEARRAIAQSPVPLPAYSIALRVYAAAGLYDSLPTLAGRWSAAAPGDESPFREWASAALQNRDRVTARVAYRTGRERLGRPDALAAEMAQLAIAEQDWDLAAREWVRAAEQLPGYRTSAGTALAQAPETARAGVLQRLDGLRSGEAARIAVDLRVRWGDPLGGFTQLLGAMPPQPGQQIELLQAFLEQARHGDTPSYRRAQALALEALGERWSTPAQQARFRLDAARAYAEAGDLVESRRLLTLVAGDTSSNRQVAADAEETLLDLLVKEGNLEEAARHLAEAERSLGVDEFLRLRLGIAMGFAASGSTDRARALLAADSTVEASALRGWIQLFGGDLKGAVEQWQEAGPFAGTRAEATYRASVLAMLQRIEGDSAPVLGGAFQLLARGDTLAAARAFETAAGQAPIDRGGAEMLERSGELYRIVGNASEAERLLRAAIHPGAPGASAAALLELGRLFAEAGRPDAAVTELERLVLEYPTSALVPQARRLLDELRNAVPST
jgi:tetratricopeptide (TPR) repeat protein